MIRSVVGITVAAISLMGVEIASITEQKGNLLTHAKFSCIDTKKNDTNASLLVLESAFQKKWDDHMLRISTNGYFLSSDTTTMKDKWISELNYGYQFGDGQSLSYLIGYNKDSFSGFQQKFYTGPALGVKMLNREKHKLELQGNILFDKDKYGEQQPESYFSSRVGAIYTWKGQDNLKFVQEESYKVKLHEADNYIFYSKSTIESKINSRLSMGINYKYDYINTPASSSPYTLSTLSALLNLRY